MFIVFHESSLARTKDGYYTLISLLLHRRIIRDPTFGKIPVESLALRSPKYSEKRSIVFNRKSLGIHQAYSETIKQWTHVATDKAKIQRSNELPFSHHPG